MCVSVFAGCSLIEIDEKSYQSAIVAAITYTDGEVDKIDKTELLLAYSSYGYNYGDDYKKAIRQTLDTVVQQHVTIKAVKNYYLENEEPLLNGNETSYLWQQTWDAVYEHIEEYYFELLNYEDEEAQNSEDTTETGVVYTPYESTVFMLDGELQIRNNTTTETVRNSNSNLKEYQDNGKSYVYDFESKEYDFKQLMFDNLYDAMGTDSQQRSVRDWRSAIRKYEDTIQRSFSYLNYKDDGWLKFECQRIYDILLNNYLVQKYTEIYNKYQNKDNNISNIKVSDVVNAYAKKVNDDYNTYRNDKSAYSEAILNSTADVDYFLNDTNQNYFRVGVIKINLSSEQQQELSNAKVYGDPVAIKSVHDRVFNNVSANERSLTTGGKTGVLKSASQILELLRGDINRLTYKTKATMTDDEQDDAYSELSPEDKTNEEKKNQAIEVWLEKYNQKVENDRAKVFRDYMFKYSDDEASKNATSDMIVGFDTNNVLLNSTITSSITDEKKLEEAKKELAKLYKPEADDTNASRTPVFGNVTDLIEADDGYYIFFYAGEVQNLFEPINGRVTLKDEDVYALREKKVSVFSDKTVFDAIYEELVSNFSDTFSVFQNLDMSALMSEEENDRRIVRKYVYFTDELYN